MRLRAILAWCAVGVVVAVVLRSGALLLAALAAALLAALVAYARRHAFASLEYRRSLSHRVVSWGAEIELTTELVNAKWLPLVWLRVVDEWPRAVEGAGPGLRPGPARRSLLLDETYSVRWFERVRRHRTGRCLTRGVHRFGPARLEAGDPLGLTTVERADADIGHLVVLPRVLPLTGFDDVGGRPLVEVDVRRSLVRDPLEVAGVRDYRAGDPLHAVNWRATARSGGTGLRVNEFEPSMAPQTMLLANIQRFAHVYEGFDADRAELVLVVTASLAVGLADRGHAVGLACNGRLSNEWRSIEVEPDSGTSGEILELLARVVAFPPPPFELVLQAEVDRPRPGTTYVVVTPPPTTRAGELLAALRSVADVRLVLVGTETRRGGGGGGVAAPAPAAVDMGAAHDVAGHVADALLVDALVPAEFDWRTADVLALA